MGRAGVCAPDALFVHRMCRPVEIIQDFSVNVARVVLAARRSFLCELQRNLARVWIRKARRGYYRGSAHT